jgi:hypothetical protein
MTIVIGNELLRVISHLLVQICRERGLLVVLLASCLLLDQTGPYMHSESFVLLRRLARFAVIM